ncbi:hypothetical protein AaE_000489 [Aphanomyces astaci]|uniref:Uncharacterized protein n=1 Tax=Aphanomyces astaci TaxID=112090 RepID=A0A6A5AZ98_APHAT|nr:hypothetical protein AaE_000489 [Aphanomyces astaci]
MNQAYARRLCVAHGGRRECLSPGCLGNARSRGYCCKHSDDHHSKVITAGELWTSESPLPARDRCSSSSFPMERRGAPSSPAVAVPPNDNVKAEGDDATACLKLIEVEAMKFVQCWDDFEIDVIDGFLSDLPMSSMMWSMQ